MDIRGSLSKCHSGLTLLFSAIIQRRSGKLPMADKTIRTRDLRLRTYCQLQTHWLLKKIVELDSEGVLDGYTFEGVG